MSSWLKFVQIFSCKLSPRKDLHGSGFLLGGGNTLMLRVHYVRWFFGWDEPLIGHFEINANLEVNSYGDGQWLRQTLELHASEEVGSFNSSSVIIK